MKKHDDQQKQQKPEEHMQGTKLQELEAHVEEWKSKYLRALADYQNLERRTQERIEDVRKTAEENLMSRLLPVVDGLKRAKEHLKDQGMDLVNKQFHAALEASGLRRMEAPRVGEDLFNPHTMECVEVVEGPDDVVMEEILPGYTIREKLLRPTQVKVGKNKLKKEA